MHVLKVELEGVTTSFRHPHLLTGRQPSFPLPPLSTLHGHIASVLGDYPAPDSFRVAFAFTHAASVDDYEHTWIMERDVRRARPGQPAPNLIGTLNPTLRQILFQPRLTLYIDTPQLQEWRFAFRSPTFPVALGRSQDLAAYRSVEVIEVVRAQAAYLEHTLLPWSLRPYVRDGQGFLMPRHISPENRHDVTWARYIALTTRALTPLPDEVEARPTLTRPLPGGFELWVDPFTPEVASRHRGLVWHTLQGDDSERLHVDASA